MKPSASRTARRSTFGWLPPPDPRAGHGHRAGLVAGESGPLGSGELAHDQLIGVVDHLSKLVVLDGPVQLHGVPVALVRVVAGAHRGEASAKLERKIRIALEVQAAWIAIEQDEREHAASDLEHGDTVSEGVILDRSRQAPAEFEDFVSCHPST
jgi:hypothetical protein